MQWKGTVLFTLLALVVPGGFTAAQDKSARDGKDRTQQWTLVRIEQPATQK
jgi:hypothetical protein